MKSTILAIAGAALILASCATQAQRQAMNLRSGFQALQQNLIACSQAVYAAPEYTVLRTHMPFNVNDATLEQETDHTIATDDEIAAILVIHPRTQACRKTFLDQLTTVAPTFVPPFAGELAAAEDSLVDLVQKRQSWGEHIRRAKKALQAGQAEIIAEARRIDERLQQSNDAELDRRQAAFNALARYYQTQQVIDAATRPRTQTVNCTALSNTVNCIGVSQ